MSACAILLNVLLVGAISAQTAHIGQLMTNADGSKGIVFYIDADGNGGLMVALTDATAGTPRAWGATGDVAGIANVGTSQNYADYFSNTAIDGKANTSFMNNGSSYARYYVSQMVGGADWFIPSSGQMSRLYAAMPFIEDSIVAAGGQIMLEANYWTSTEYDANNAVYYNFNREVASMKMNAYLAKTSTAYVRAIRAFRYNTVATDGTIAYSWDVYGGARTTGNILVRPTVDTTYKLSATFTTPEGFVCHSNEVSRSVNVNPTTSSIKEVEACDTYIWNGHTITSSGDTSVTMKGVNKDGCDSTVTLRLTLKHSSDNTAFVKNVMTDVDNLFPYTFEYKVNDIVYSQDLNSLGEYRTTAQNAVGCDSVTSLILKAYPSNMSTQNCDLIPDPLAMTWGIKKDWSSKREVSPNVIPLVGDLNGNGRPEIVCFAANSYTTPKIGESFTPSTKGEKTILIYDGVTKQLVRTFTIPGIADVFGPTPYGIIRVPNDDFSDTIGLIVIAKRQSLDYVLGFSQNLLLAYDMNGNKVWESNIFADGESTTEIEKLGQSTLGFADFNNDGHPEVYIRNKVFDAYTGRLLARAPGTNVGAAWSYKVSGSYYFADGDGRQNGYISFPMAADVLGNARQELILGGAIYDVKITNRNGLAGNSITLAKQSAPAYPTTMYDALDGHAQVADFNNDGHADILISTRANNSNSSQVYMYVWDVYNNTTSSIFRIDVTAQGKSMPAIGDLDHDGLTDVVIQTGITSAPLRAYSYNPSTSAFSLKWSYSPGDNSYANSVSLFDFNMDDKLEVVTHGSQYLRILSHNGSQLASYGSAIDPTIMTYPIIADVDTDGHAEIIVIDTLSSKTSLTIGHLRVLKSSTTTPWAGTRSVWNQYMYHSTNIEDNLTVPAFAFGNYAIIPGPIDGMEHHSYYNALGDYVLRQPFNGFLMQSPMLDQFGRRYESAADAELAQLTSSDTVINNENLTANLNYCNHGDADLKAPYYITTYRDSVQQGYGSHSMVVLQRDTMTQPLEVGQCTTKVVTVQVKKLCEARVSKNQYTDTTRIPFPDYYDEFDLIFSVNDRGDGVAQNGTGNQAECDTINNQDTIHIDLRRFDTTHDTIDTACVATGAFVWREGHNREFFRDTVALDTNLNALRCTHIRQMTLKIYNDSVADSVIATVCKLFTDTHGDSTFVFHNVEGQNTTKYERRWEKAVHGFCDSVYHYRLTIYDDSLLYIVDTACVRWQGRHYTYTETGTYLDTVFDAVHGLCDSTFRYELAIYHDSTADHKDTLVCKVFHGHRRDFTQLGIQEILDTAFNGVHGVCDSVYPYRLNIVDDLRADTLDTTVCNGLLWRGVNYTVSSMTAQARPYEDTVFGAVQGTCDSIYTLDIEVYIDSFDTVTYVKCHTFVWRDSTFSIDNGEMHAGYHLHRDTVHKAIHGVCDSVYFMHLTLNEAKTSVVYDTVCDSVLWWGEWRTTTGDYFHTSYQVVGETGESADRCDSLYTYHLAVYSDSTIDTATYLVCKSFSWRGHSFALNGTSADIAYNDTLFRDTVTNAVHKVCDSIYWLHLELRNDSTVFAIDTVCNGRAWRKFDNDIDNGFSSLTVTGEYRDTIFSAIGGGCDSIYVLNVAVYRDSFDTIRPIVCHDFTWRGNEYLATIDRTETVSGAVHRVCDSLYTMELTVYNDSLSDTLQVVACKEHDWRSIHFSLDGGTAHDAIHEDRVPNAVHGVCDSFYYVHLVLHNDSTHDSTLIVCDSVIWWGQKYTTTDDYVHVSDNVVHGVCDSIYTLHLSVYTLRNHPVRNIEVCDYYNWRPNYSRVEISGDYTDTVHNAVYGVCDSVYHLSAIIHPNAFGDSIDTVCNGASWRTYATITVSGLYSDTLRGRAAYGCDSVYRYNIAVYSDSTTSIIDTVVCSQLVGHQMPYLTSGIYYDTAFNAVHRVCDSVFVYNLTVYNDTHVTPYTFDICNRTVWRGHTISESGTYRDTAENVIFGVCDSIFTVNITVYSDSIASVEEQNVCSNFTWERNGKTYSESGLYGDTLVGRVHGVCDSIYPLHLTMGAAAVHELTMSVENSYSWHGRTLTESGVYRDTNYLGVHSVAGCDTVDILYLFIGTQGGCEGVGTHLAQTSCDSYQWHEAIYINAGTYLYYYNNGEGCLTVDTLDLTINRSNGSDTNAAEIDQFTWRGHTYTASGSYNDTLHNVAGCDSIVTLRLVITHPTCETTYGDIYASACDSYVWPSDGQTYDSDEELTDVLRNAEGCDSVRTLHLTIRHSSTGTDVQTACDRYEWHGNTYTSSTTTPTYTSTNVAGCDSVTTLHLTIKSSVTRDTFATTDTALHWHGVRYEETGTYSYPMTGAAANNCDSTDVLHLVIVAPSGCEGVGTHVAQTSCDSYQWHDAIYVNAGTYLYYYNNGEGCLTVDTLDLTINRSNGSDTNAAEIDQFTWRGHTYTASGSYNDTLHNVAGCDSIVTLRLVITHSTCETTYGDIYASACDSYIWSSNGQTYTTDSELKDTLRNAGGCDSVRTLHLTIKNSSAYTDVHSECDSYEWHGNTYTSSTTTPTYTSTNAAGCDSITTLNLTIKSSVTRDTFATVDSAYHWRGERYAATGTYRKTMSESAASGCDSVVALHLVVTTHICHRTYGTIYDTACDSYTWAHNGRTYSNSTALNDTLTNADGCDSVRTLQLTIYKSAVSETYLTVCDHATWRGNTYATSNTYEETKQQAVENKCDSIYRLILVVNHGVGTLTKDTVCGSKSWNGQVYASTGEYIYNHATAENCTAVDTLRLVVYNDSNAAEERIVVCEGNSYSYHGETLNASGRHTVVRDNAVHGKCDSIYHIDLTLNANERYEATDAAVTVCDAYTWGRNGQQYTTTQVAEYRKAGVAADNCDSTYRIAITVYSNDTADTLRNQVACDSYTFKTKTYTASGLYNDTIHNAVHGVCDSIYPVYVTVNHSNSAVYRDTACGSYEWHGVTYAASTTAPTYTSTNAAGCDSVTTLHLVIYSDSVAKPDTVIACANYTWPANGQQYAASGTYTYRKQHAVHGKCDSVYTLQLTIGNTIQIPEIHVACDSFRWERNPGTLYTSTPDVAPTFVATGSISGCDTVYHLNLTVHQAQHTATSAEACKSYQWSLTGNTYTLSGTYERNHYDGNGCYATDTLHLTVYNDSFAEAETIIDCRTVTWRGDSYTATGVYYDTVKNHVHSLCDSIYTLNLTIGDKVEVTDNVTACDSTVWERDGVRYYATTTTPEVVKHNSANGACDTVYHLNLTVHQAQHKSIKDTVCKTYAWSNQKGSRGTGNSYTSTDTYLNTYRDETNGNCYTTDTLRLTVYNDSFAAVEPRTECLNLTWRGTTYNTSGIYYDTVKRGVHGWCDSIYTLNLTIGNEVVATTASNVCDSLTWRGKRLTVSGQYKDTVTDAIYHVCDSVYVLNLTVYYADHQPTTEIKKDTFHWHGSAYSETGDYLYNRIDANGCYATDTLHLTIYSDSLAPIKVDTACESYVWRGKTYTESGYYRDTVKHASHTVADSIYHLRLTIAHNVTVYDTATA
ncbi:MAG: VCBS repeat-containing protein, partial [Bacteroidales bacterium]|nr:VCBS repeat-containing protein [Bacteroidales bacterium]